MSFDKYDWAILLTAVVAGTIAAIVVSVAIVIALT